MAASRARRQPLRSCQLTGRQAVRNSPQCPVQSGPAAGRPAYGADHRHRQAVCVCRHPPAPTGSLCVQVSSLTDMWPQSGNLSRTLFMCVSHSAGVWAICLYACMYVCVFVNRSAVGDCVSKIASVYMPPGYKNIATRSALGLKVSEQSYCFPCR